MILPRRSALVQGPLAALTCHRLGSWLRGFEILSTALILSAALQDAMAAPRPQALEDRVGERGKREEREKQISKLIQAPSDDEWTQVLGDKSQLKFPVTQGSTLYGISKELFGDAKYWPKIWALNNGAILNPHVIRPGQVVAFMGGTTSSLPGVTVIDAGKEALPTENSQPVSASGQALQTEVPAEKSEAPSPESLEWKNLPPQQSWEVTPLTPETIQAELRGEQTQSPSKASGLDALRLWPDRGIQLESIPSNEKIQSIATITGSRSEGLLLGKGDMVYVEADGDLAIGETYSITRKEASLIKSRKSDRAGWSNENLGTIRILSLKEGIYVGQILDSSWEIQRGDLLIPSINKAFARKPIPGPAPVEGTLLLYRSNSLYATSQYKQVFIDRGSEDGVQPGMVFRSYQYWDPGTGERFTDSDFIVDSDILVIHTTEEFSVGIVLSSLSPVVEGSTLVLLTDVSDVLTKNGYRTRTAEEVQRDAELDELDRLPPPSALEEEERRELEQLEKWKKNPGGTEDVREQDLEEAELPPPPPLEAAPSEKLDAESATEPPSERSPAPPDDILPPPTEESTQEATEEPEELSEELPPPPAESEPTPSEPDTSNNEDELD